MATQGISSALPWSATPGRKATTKAIPMFFLRIRSPSTWPNSGIHTALRLGPPAAQQVPAQQQILLLRGEDLQRDSAVVLCRFELLDVLRPVRRASGRGPQRQVLVRRAVVLGQVDVPQLGAE